MGTGFIPPELVAKAKEMDLLTFLQTYEPDELVRVSPHEYCTRTHDSLKISNGKWMWWSRGFGGKNAVDYLIAVKGLTFYQAVRTILDYSGHSRPPNAFDEPRREKHLILPERAESNDTVIRYLKGRGIAENIIADCIENGSIYESLPYHNVVFVGFNENQKPRYAGLRGTDHSDYKGDACGSDKAYTFRIVNENSDTLHVFEGPIDLLSYATLLQLNGINYRDENLLSLSGVYSAKQYESSVKVPASIKNFLDTHPKVKNIELHLDRDKAGINASTTLIKTLSERFCVRSRPPPRGKDVNDYLCLELGLPITRTKKSIERTDAR